MTSICTGCSKIGNFTQQCPICLKTGTLGSLFCSSECYTQSWKEHKKVHISRKVLKPRLDLNADTLSIFYTKGCKPTLQTSRLNLRAIELTDAIRIGTIKSEPQVYNSQLYGIPTLSHGWAFAESYVTGGIPAPATTLETGRGRMRHVWGLEFREDVEGEMGKGDAGEGKKRGSVVGIKRVLDKKGYIGNVAIAIERNGKERSLYLKDGIEFLYPTAAQLKKDGVEASIFYEIHPTFWNQGLMTESLFLLLHYAFTTLLLPSITIDPRSNNLTSIHLALKLGGIFEGVHSKHGIEQRVYRIERGLWLEGRRERGDRDLMGEVMNKDEIEGKRVCRWCMVPNKLAEIRCEKCDWAWYCSKECCEADLRFVKGHFCS